MAFMLDATSPSRRSRIVVVLVAAVLIGAAFGAWFVRNMARDRVTFTNEIQPILNQKYVPCHGGVRQKNGILVGLSGKTLSGRGRKPRCWPSLKGRPEIIPRLDSTKAIGSRARLLPTARRPVPESFVVSPSSKSSGNGFYVGGVYLKRGGQWMFESILCQVTEYDSGVLES